MAGERLDSLARALAGTASRRQMVKVVLGAAFGGLLARSGAGPLVTRPAAAETACSPGCPDGAPCIRKGGDFVCCAGGIVGGDRNDRVGCDCNSATTSGISCQKGNVVSCCPTNAACTDTPGSQSCACNDTFTPAMLNGQLVACCPAGAQAQNGQCICDNTNAPPIDGKCEACTPQNCKGCCDANGACQDGGKETVCGTGGAACAVCPSHSLCWPNYSASGREPGGQCICDGTGQAPAGGACPDHCGPDTCPNSCCFDGRCATGPGFAGISECGTGGVQCKDCPAFETTCINGECICLSNNQPPCGPNHQCCPYGGTCQSGACICTSTGNPPTPGITRAPACPDCGSCSNGCCTDEVLMAPQSGQFCILYAGQSVERCGSNGQLCFPCGIGQTCQQGVCVCRNGGQPPVNGQCPGICGVTTPCPDGCCDPTTLRCVHPAQQTNSQCGTNGETCKACPKAAVCQDYLRETSVGHVDDGQQCVCSTSGLPAVNNACPPCNSSTCPAGCCDSTGTCQPGTSAGACGPAGGTCANCGASGVCQNGACGCPSVNSTCPGGTAFCSLWDAGQPFCRAVCCPSGTCPTSEVTCACNTTDAWGNQGASAACITNNTQPNAPFIFTCCGGGTVCATNVDATALGLRGRDVCCPVAQTCCSYGPLDLSKGTGLKGAEACITVGTGPFSVAAVCCAPGDTCCPGSGNNNNSTCCPSGSSCTAPGICTLNTTCSFGAACVTDNDCGGACICIGAGAGVSGTCGVPL